MNSDSGIHYNTPRNRQITDPQQLKLMDEIGKLLFGNQKPEKISNEAKTPTATTKDQPTPVQHR
jgi:hypothetical protein